MVKATDVPMIKLNNGVEMPQVGLGVWKAADGDEVKHAVSTALADGYRLIDTARIYGNEAGVGEAVRTSGLPRQDIFVTTKLWNDDHGYEATLKAFDASLRRLGLDYVDLYLIHWPVPSKGKFLDSWKALEKLYRDKRVRAIGVSNFKPQHLEEILANNGIVPAINQIELHPHMQQLETRAFCVRHGIQVESYSPLKRAGDVFSEPAIQEIADHYGKTPAQIVLRWHVQEDLVVIPKSVTPERIQENIDIFDFALNDDEMTRIRGLNRDQRIGSDPDIMGA
jgi:2,5-diketo-D-gluconate reductase A